MVRSLRLALLATTASLVAAAPSPTLAQADNASGQIETVVVTAQKRTQNIIAVPIALTAYSGRFLNEIGVQEFDKLSLFVPGFEVQNQSPNNPGFVMRGITSDSGESTQEPRVSVFQDGVSISKSRGSYVELFDIERIEIAKGPQSTLFGRGALIGAVNIIENKADPSRFAWSGGAEYGNYNYGMVEAMVNMPLSDDFAVRLAGRYKRRDGYTKNLLGGADFNSTDTAAGRASFAYTPNERLRLDVIFNYEHDDPSGTGFKSGTFAPTDPVTGAPLGDLSHTSGAALSAAPDFPAGNKLGIKREVEGVTGLFRYAISNAITLHSISAWRKFDALEVFDPDGFSLPMLTFAEHARGEQESQEFRINYDNGGKLTWFAGASYFHDNGFQAVPAELNEPMALALLGGGLSAPYPQPAGYFASPAYLTSVAPVLLQNLATGLGYSLPLATAQGIAANLTTNHQEESTNYSTTTAYDFYGEATYKLTDEFEITGGLRYTTETKTSGLSAKILNTGSVLGGVVGAASLDPFTRALVLNLLATNPAALPPIGVVAMPTVGNGNVVSQDMSDGAFTWRTTARYMPNQDTSFYVSYARGRRAPVLSALPPTLPYGSPVFTRVPAETVDSYEVGAKALTLDGTLRLTGAVYYYDYNNFQTLVAERATLVTENAGRASSIGFEGSLDWAVTPWARLFAAYSYSHGRFDSGAFKGNMFRLSPDHKLSLGAVVSHEMMGGVFTLVPTFTWQSKIFFDDNNDIAALQTNHILPDRVRDELQRAYGLVNLRLSYQPSDAPWSVEAFVDNVADTKYIKDAGNTGDYFGIPTFIAGIPRVYGFGVRIASD